MRYIGIYVGWIFTELIDPIYWNICWVYIHWTNWGSCLETIRRASIQPCMLAEASDSLKLKLFIVKYNQYTGNYLSVDIKGPRNHRGNMIPRCVSGRGVGWGGVWCLIGPLYHSWSNMSVRGLIPLTTSLDNSFTAFRYLYLFSFSYL